MELKINKNKVLKAASKSETAKEVLKTLFPNVFEEEFWELKIKKNKEIYFVNTLTKQTFNIGDEITIKDHGFSFGDGIRRHIIKDFYYQSDHIMKKSLYKDVYASFKGYNYERALLLDQIIKI